MWICLYSHHGPRSIFELINLYSAPSFRDEWRFIILCRFFLICRRFAGPCCLVSLIVTWIPDTIHCCEWTNHHANGAGAGNVHWQSMKMPVITHMVIGEMFLRTKRWWAIVMWTVLLLEVMRYSEYAWSFNIICAIQDSMRHVIRWSSCSSTTSQGVLSP